MLVLPRLRVARGGCWLGRCGCDPEGHTDPIFPHHRPLQTHLLPRLRECDLEGHTGILLRHRRLLQILRLPRLRRWPGLDLLTLGPYYGEQGASNNPNPGPVGRVDSRMS